MTENKKRKNNTTLIAMIIVFFIVFGAIVGYLLITQQKYNETGKIAYDVGENVAAAVRVEYYIPNSDDGIQIVENKGSTNLTDSKGYLDLTNSTDDNWLDIGEIKLTSETPSVEFYFTIENKFATGYLQVDLSPDYPKDDFKIEYLYYNADSFTASTSATTIHDELFVDKHYNNVVAKGFKIIKVVLTAVTPNSQILCKNNFALSLYHSDEAQNVSILSRERVRSLTNETNTIWVFDEAKNDSSYLTTGIDVSEAGDGSIWTYTSGTTRYILSNQGIALPADSSYMFNGKSGTQSYKYFRKISFNNIYTSNVTNMSYMFSDNNSLTSIDVSGFDTSNVTKMSYMFYSCKALTTLDVSNFDTSTVTNMSYMFAGCFELTSLDVSGFDTSNVTNMTYMFTNCWALTSLDVSNFDTSRVTNMSYMFAGCFALASLDVTGFDTSSVTDMSSMFTGCTALTSLDLSTWDTKQVTVMSLMFYRCMGLEKIYIGSGWSTAGVTSHYQGSDMFEGCTSLVGKIAYDSSKTDYTMANYTTGYLTLKTA